MTAPAPEPLPSRRWTPREPPREAVHAGRSVTLVPFGSGHGDQIWELVRGHEELWTYLPADPPEGAAAMVGWLERWRRGAGAVLFAIVPAASGRAEGWAAYSRVDPANGVIEVANILLSPRLQRTPAATEAMYLMARHIFDDLGYRRYEWKCDRENEPSRRAALRLGFVPEGIFRQHMVVKGRNRDTAWFSMLDREWGRRRQALEAWLDPGNFDGEGRQRRSLGEIAAAGETAAAPG